MDGKWRKPCKGANEAFDLFCYAHAVAVLRGYEKFATGKNLLHGLSRRISTQIFMKGSAPGDNREKTKPFSHKSRLSLRKKTRFPAAGWVLPVG